MRPGPQNIPSHASTCPAATQQPPGQPRLLTLAHTYSEPRRLSPQRYSCAPRGASVSLGFVHVSPVLCTHLVR